MCFPHRLEDPYADETTQPFWTAALEGRLLGMHVHVLRHVRHAAQRRAASTAGHDAFEWVELPGTGAIYSFTVVRHPLAGYLQAVVPYVSAVVELDGTQGAGARMVANVVDCDPDEIRIGTRVRVVFDHVNDKLAVPRFTPI